MGPWEKKKNKETILCVDDEENIVHALKRTLLPAGYNVLTALSGEEALHILENEHVDLIISDQRMPKMSGYEFLKAVRDKYSHCIRMMLSGYSDFESLIKTVNEGEIIRYVVKPWDNSELVETVRIVLAQKKVMMQVQGLLVHLRDVVAASKGFKMETIEEHGTIVLKVTPEEKITSEREVFDLLEFLLRMFGEDSKDKFNVLSRHISKNKNDLVFDIELGNRIVLKIIIKAKDSLTPDASE